MEHRMWLCMYACMYWDVDTVRLMVGKVMRKKSQIYCVLLHIVEDRHMSTLCIRMYIVCMDVTFVLLFVCDFLFIYIFVSVACMHVWLGCTLLCTCIEL